MADSDKFTPEEYVKAILGVATNLLDSAEEHGIELSASWSMPNALRRVDGKSVIDVNEASKNMGSLTIKFEKKVEIPGSKPPKPGG
jgi:hypothetical protein